MDDRLPPGVTTNNLPGEREQVEYPPYETDTPEFKVAYSELHLGFDDDTRDFDLTVIVLAWRGTHGHMQYSVLDKRTGLKMKVTDEQIEPFRRVIRDTAREALQS